MVEITVHLNEFTYAAIYTIAFIACAKSSEIRSPLDTRFRKIERYPITK